MRCCQNKNLKCVIVSDKDDESHYLMVKYLVKLLPEVTWKVGHVPSEVVALEEAIKKP